MSLSAGFLIVITLSVALFAGIIAAMASVIQPTLNRLDYRTFTLTMQGIIVSGRQSPTILILLTMPIGLTLFVLYAFWLDRQWLPFSATLLGFILFLTGGLLVSRYLNEPYYDQIMTWSPDNPAPNWQAARQRWFSLNLVRLTLSLLASLAYFTALITLP